MSTATDTAKLAKELGDAAVADAKKIDNLILAAVTDIEAILAKYADISVPVLSGGRGAVMQLKMQFQRPSMDAAGGHASMMAPPVPMP